MQLATIDGHELTVSKTQLAIIVAIIGVIPSIVTSLTDAVLKPMLPHSSYNVEMAKLEAEKHKAAVAVYQSALMIPDAAQRQALIRFLVQAKLLDKVEATTAGPMDEVPYWPAASTTPH